MLYDITRRKLVAGTGAAVTTGLVGCLRTGDESNGPLSEEIEGVFDLYDTVATGETTSEEIEDETYADVLDARQRIDAPPTTVWRFVPEV